MNETRTHYPTLMAIPRPNVGDTFYRRTLVNQYEEAIVVSILSSDPGTDDWSATFMTKNGVEFVSGDVEHRTPHDWMPKGWVYDPARVAWVPPKSILRDDTKEATDPVEEERVSQTNVFMLPTPWEGEKFMSWRSRTMKSLPALKDRDNAREILSQAWKDKNYEMVL